VGFFAKVHGKVRDGRGTLRGRRGTGNPDELQHRRREKVLRMKKEERYRFEVRKREKRGSTFLEGPFEISNGEGEPS